MIQANLQGFNDSINASELTAVPTTSSKDFFLKFFSFSHYLTKPSSLANTKSVNQDDVASTTSSLFSEKSLLETECKYNFQKLPKEFN
jgi:hypothetical protein